MNILIPVAAYHVYNTAVYVQRALTGLGHAARVITQAEFYEDQPGTDLFFGVDSAGPLDFPDKHLPKTAMWFIDSRHNNDPARRTPDDDSNARRLARGGGWVFQAQKRDWERNVQQGILRCSWLPLAADPGIWRPLNVSQVYDVGFGGNVWCGPRREILDRIAQQCILGSFTGPPETLVQGYAQSQIGFNISSFYGSPVAYDVNMRVFEVLACGRPLVTNDLPDLVELGIVAGQHCLTYQDPGGALAQIRSLLDQSEVARDEMGRRARALVLEGHTYRHRMEEAVEILRQVEVV